MSDFWDDSANSETPEPPKATYEGLPDGVNVIARTCSGQDKETVQPKIKDIDGKNGTFYRFKLPVVVIGGESKVDPKFVGRYLFLDLNVEKPTVEQLNKAIATATTNGNDATVKRLQGQLGALDKYPCAPELYNLILDTLAPEGEKASERWPVAVAQLKAKATEAGLTLASCKGNGQYLYAAAFKELLMGQSFTVIGKTYTPKQREGSDYTPQQTLGSIGVDSTEQRKKRKVALIDAPASEEAF